MIQFKNQGSLGTVQADAELDANWKQIKITNLKFLRAALIMKHGSLGDAVVNSDLNPSLKYANFSGKRFEA